MTPLGKLRRAQKRLAEARRHAYVFCQNPYAAPIPMYYLEVECNLRYFEQHVLDALYELWAYQNRIEIHAQNMDLKIAWHEFVPATRESRIIQNGRGSAAYP